MTLSASQIAFYGADTVDYVNAVAVAETLTTPTANVTGSFNTAANWVHNGTYMVVAIGGPASTALYWNPCGWTTTAFSLPACSTPFTYYTFPYDGSISANHFLCAAGVGRLESLQLALMLGWYAIHGSYPSGMCSLPTVMERSGTCSTSYCSGTSTNSCPSTS